MEISRRQFFKLGLGAAFSSSGLLVNSPRVFAASLSFNLVAETYTKTMVDGSSTSAWRFRSLDAGGGGPGQLEAGLIVQEGDSITINLTNNIGTSLRFGIPGVFTNGAISMPGTTEIYQFTAPAGGSYFFCDLMWQHISRGMGLSAPFVVMPAGGGNSLPGSNQTIDKQYTLFLNEMDTRLNDSVSAGGSYALAAYEPNYFFVNGLSYPETTQDADTLLAMNLGDTVAIRLINSGLIYSSLHFHGYHVQVINRNRVVEQTVVEKDTVLLAPQECVDVLLSVVQRGTYPVHNHFLPAVTANGVYANGALVLIQAS